MTTSTFTSLHQGGDDVHHPHFLRVSFEISPNRLYQFHRSPHLFYKLLLVLFPTLSNSSHQRIIIQRGFLL
ncbi:unnamed protein product [Lactuca virosa]|uniref:Uncharacterized protein n=1 Tax=Lactuca virosa TaxID=75947 RepID=A0AAU9PJQ4_9ASTR|nr:unnamed protein product [Lactuca virosa]